MSSTVKGRGVATCARFRMRFCISGETQNVTDWPLPSFRIRMQAVGTVSTKTEQLTKRL